jgi:hypothetical protein
MQNEEEFTVVGWARINERGDLYDLSLHFNPFIDQKTVVELYVKKKVIGENNEKAQ